MKEYDLDQLLNNPDKVDQMIGSFLQKEVLQKQKRDPAETEGHLLKAYHNLRFVSQTKPEFYDWAVVGCYYACYQASLALILVKGYASKNHLATLCILIKHFYRKELDREDLELFSRFLDYFDLLFYVETKNRREDAAYSAQILFQKKEVEQLKLKASLFVDKINQIIKDKVE